MKQSIKHTIGALLWGSLCWTGGLPGAEAADNGVVEATTPTTTTIIREVPTKNFAKPQVPAEEWSRSEEAQGVQPQAKKAVKMDAVAAKSASDAAPKQDVDSEKEKKELGAYLANIRIRANALRAIAPDSDAQEDYLYHLIHSETADSMQYYLYYTGQEYAVRGETSEVAMLIGGGIPEALDLSVYEKHVEGAFTRYTKGQESFLVYTGNTRPIPNTPYQLRHGEVVQIHIANPKYNLVGGNFPMEEANRGLLFPAYGPPQAVAREEQDGTTKSLLFLYSPNPNGRAGRTTAEQDVKRTLEGALMVFRMENGQIKSLDYYAPGMATLAGLDHIPLRWYSRNTLEDADFQLMGTRLGDTVFTSAGQAQSWTGESRKLFGMRAIGQASTHVLVDDKNEVHYVILRADTASTSRGIGLSMGRVVVLATNGIPDAVYDEFSFKRKPGDVVYEYKNPYQPNQYLDFVVGDDHFVTAIILADRPVSEMRLSTENRQEALRELYFIYNDIPGLQKALPAMREDRKVGI